MSSTGAGIASTDAFVVSHNKVSRVPYPLSLPFRSGRLHYSSFHQRCLTSVVNFLIRPDWILTTPAKHHRVLPTFRNLFRWSIFQGTNSVSFLSEGWDQKVWSKRCLSDAQNVNIINSKYDEPTAVSYSHRRLVHSPDPLRETFGPAIQRPQLKRCPPLAPMFTGRDDVLAQMRQYFFNDSRDQHIFFLYGLGGAGKTQIALKFVTMCQDETVPRWVRRRSYWLLCLDI